MSPGSPPLARAQDVSCSVGEGALRTQVLRGLSLAVQPGELTVLMGPSGSGKTTLISILAGLLRPTSGTVDLCGARITALDDALVAAVRRRSLGFVFQGFHLFPALTATDNVAEVLALSGLPIGAARERARGLLREVGLGDRLEHRPGQLSAGQRQRVAIARALAPGPRLVIADEPTVALDGPTAREVMALLRAFVAPGTGVLLVTHDARLVEPGDRVVQLADARLASDERATPSAPPTPAMEPR